jgi:Kef-type K+ transport system membrane component KefB
MADESSGEAALPYHEPGITSVLIISSLVLLLNIGNHVVDKILYCGLLAQILLGITYGTPGGSWLGGDFETAVVNLGYLGLLLIVYEGGLATSVNAVKENILLSIGVALTGIALPIAASYVLLSLVGATSLQCFAAGAALCSTSLGTTFTVLNSSSLMATRLGTVLTSAAMMDDVVGLVMVQVISNLGRASNGFSATDVVRPVFVSLAFVVIVPLTARFFVVPLTSWLNQRRKIAPNGLSNRLLGLSIFPLVIHTLLLVGLITAAVYAGTSGLFAAYLAGTAIAWWDAEVPHFEQTEVQPEVDTVRSSQQIDARSDQWTGLQTFEIYYSQPLQRILKPFFFASIGFSVPITRMFSGDVVWKGVIYIILMFAGKFACEFWA